MARSQIRVLFPKLQDLPILELRGSGNRYFVLAMAQGKGKIYSPPTNGVGTRRLGTVPFLKMEMIQYAYDPYCGALYGIQAFTVEEPLLEKIIYDEWGIPSRALGLRRWRQVKFRELDPGELLALKREIPNIVPARRKGEARRALDFFQDENYIGAAEKLVEVGEAVGPENPVPFAQMWGKKKPSIIVTGAPWKKAATA